MGLTCSRNCINTVESVCDQCDYSSRCVLCGSIKHTSECMCEVVDEQWAKTEEETINNMRDVRETIADLRTQLSPMPNDESLCMFCNNDISVQDVKDGFVTCKECDNQTNKAKSAIITKSELLVDYCQRCGAEMGSFDCCRSSTNKSLRGQS